MIDQQDTFTGKLTETFIRLPLFEGLDKKIFPDLLEKLNYELIELSKGDTIIRQGTQCNHLYILLKGDLEVNIVEATGNNIKVETIVAPRVFATPHLFNGNDIFPATFTVVKPGLLFRSTKETVFELISSLPDLLKNFLRIRGNCNACTIGRLRILSHKGVRSRFINYLLLHKQEECLAVFDHNQTQLAEYLNVSRPALAKEIRLMSEEGLIRVSGKNVFLAMPQVLLKYY